MCPTLALAAHQLERQYKGSDFYAVAGVSLSIRFGEIVTLLGPNGAGKTTIVKMCSGLLTPSAGSVLVSGVDIYGSRNVKDLRIGLVLGGETGFYGRATARENLLYFADLQRVPAADRKNRVAEVLGAVDLEQRGHSKVAEFSRGMRQRLHIARGLLGRPDLLLLDEPTSGLDPEQARSIRVLVRQLASESTGILLTTHHLNEAEALSDKLMVLKEGVVAAQGSVQSIVDASGLRQVTTFSVEAGSEVGTAVIEGWASHSLLDLEHFHGRDHLRLQWRDVIEADLFEEWLVATHSRPADYVRREPTLEESYLVLVASSEESQLS